jgi:phosphinothricin acetyltransferase
MGAARPPPSAPPAEGKRRAATHREEHTSAQAASGERSAYVVRAACRDDVAAVTRIYGHHVAHGLASFELAPPAHEEMLKRHDDIVARGYPYLVAERDGAIGGYAYASAYRARPAYRFAVENSVYIDPALKRSGLGRLLLEALIAACEARGFRQMIAVIGDSGNAPSIGLHAACGFARIGTLPAIGWKFDRWVDSVLMQRALGPGAATPPDEIG